MMVEAAKPRQRDEDEARSKRFLETAATIEADGGLIASEAEWGLDRLVRGGAKKLAERHKE